jgi:GNAT superfamily N-acetyltransferase
MEFRRVGVDARALRDYAALMQTCFPHAAKFDETYLGWLYRDNPEGQAIGFDAVDAGRLAAHYVCLPTRVLLGGVVMNALLSLNTATHPEYQGKGLFTRLAEMTYAAGAVEGFGAVYGVANAGSTPGFIRKLGFQLVGPLRACIGIGSLDVDFDKTGSAQFARTWSAASLQWRCANPANPVSCQTEKGHALFHAPAKGKLLQVCAELPAAAVHDLPQVKAHNELWAPPVRLFLGQVPAGACRFTTYIDIPQRLRPSPLNFIYRPLSRSTQTLEREHIHFSFMDFDAY